MTENETLNQDEIIERVKTQTEQLWQTIQEAKKSNLKIQVGFEDYFIKPKISIMEDIYCQG
jgi:hypothetical protein